MKLRSLVVGAVALILGAMFLGGTPASAGDQVITLTVIKTVEGEAPADAEFVINVYCVRDQPTGMAATPAGGDGPLYDEDITFGPEGGEQEFGFVIAAQCVITEIDDGGADEVINREIEVAIEEAIDYEDEITNVFSDVVTTSTTTTAAPTTTAAAAAAAATPRFTG